MEDFEIQYLSVLDARSAIWRHRKREWLDIIGPESESREKTLYGSAAMRFPGLYARTKEVRERLGISFDEYIEQYGSEDTRDTKEYSKMSEGVSTFDPVLAEIIYDWFTPCQGAKIFDCFAGGVTKGAVAMAKGHSFTGIDIRPNQVEINKDRYRTFSNVNLRPRYYCDDARNLLKYIGVASQDLFISCPPYYNLEVYSDLDGDASNQPTYQDFIEILQDAFEKAVKCLKRNRFAVVVVGDIRDEKGKYYNFPGDVISIFQNCGCAFLDDIVLFRSDATANLRAKRYMKSRKVVRVHERVLVFYKGNPTSVKKYFNPLKLHEL